MGINCQQTDINSIIKISISCLEYANRSHLKKVGADSRALADLHVPVGAIGCEAHAPLKKMHTGIFSV